MSALQQRAQQGALARARHRKRRQCDQYRAAHHQRQRRVSRASQVQKAQYPRRIGHAGHDQADAEHQSHCKGNQYLHGPLLGQHVAQEVHGNEPRQHERPRGRQRARRPARQSTHAMAAGAASAVARAQAHQLAGHDQHGVVRFKRKGGQERGQRIPDRRDDQAADKRQAPADIATRGPQQAAEHAADAGDPAIQSAQRSTRGADQQAAGQRRLGGEIDPVDGHEYVS